MSAEAEAAKSFLEVYQPLIVGLGAVVIGFLANSLLEWLKLTLARSAEVRKLRRAIYLDVLSFRSSMSGTLEDIDELVNAENDHSSIFIPVLVLSLDGREFGALSPKELEFLAMVISGAKALKYVSDRIYKDTEPGVAFLVGLNAANKESVTNVVEATVNCCDQYISATKKFL